MSSIGWEVWGLKFSWFLTAVLSLIFAVTVRLAAHDPTGRHQVDAMAGDEGEDW